ncbi:MAG TPA: beta-lactamase family protein [Candidatus Gemmiger excrementigallinarum]|uniref:Beta-lactamase family protein n=1 Tax=Candidatus Gemmiger excrementigallinarum TaxID=2838609 RepID=A0A9D2J9Z1_9FIRM|nr:beta-lactamase family protein [Candidatus Gemmiger excrementigallinarum]
MDFSKLTAYLKTLESNYGVHGLDLKITKDHREVYRCMLGSHDYEGKVPVSAKDLYNIYSASKVITVTGVMQLIEQGRLGLDDCLEQYLPTFSSMQYATDFRIGEFPQPWPTRQSPLRPARNKIRIHDLMSMTAGLSYDLGAEPIRRVVEQSHGEAGTREIVTAMAEMPLICEPGTRYSYALGHDVLAAVVEVVTGMTFGRYMQENLFAPLGITEMYYQVPAGAEDRLAAQYAKDWNTGEIRPDQTMAYRFTKNYESGGAGLCTTVDEYSKVLDALANGGVGANGRRILKPESIALMSRNWLNEQQLADFAKCGKDGYGYGLGVRTLMDGTKAKSPVGEFGWDGAAGAFSLVDPANHLCLYYAHQILGMLEAYSEIHPTIRDLTYEGLEL